MSAAPLLTKEEIDQLEKAGIEVIFGTRSSSNSEYLVLPPGASLQKALVTYTGRSVLFNEWGTRILCVADTIVYIPCIRGVQMSGFTVRTGSFENPGTDRLFANVFRRRALKRAMKILGA